jgi:excisionase family DNA binding protein
MNALPPNIAAAVVALVGPYLPSLSAEEVSRRLAAGPAGELQAVVTHSLTQTARILGVSRRTVYAMIRAGKLPCVTLGHRTKRVPHAALVALLDPAGIRN